MPSSPRRPRRRRRSWSSVAGLPDSKSLASQPCEGTTSPSSKRRATSAARCGSRRCSTNLTFGCSGGTSTRCGAWRSTSARHDRNPRGGCCASPDHVVVATGAARTARRCPGPTAHTSSTATTSASCSPVLALPGRRGSFRCRSSRARHRSSGRFDRRPGDPRQAHRAVHAGGKRVVIIGGGLVGAELAEFLMERDRKVTVLEEGDKLALEMAHLGVGGCSVIFVITASRSSPEPATSRSGPTVSPGRPTRARGGCRHRRDRSTGRW